MGSPQVPPALLARASRWEDLKRWERRELGQELRRLGLSYSEIADVIPVAKGTLSGWCRGIQLTPEQQARLAAKRPRLDAYRRLGRQRHLAAEARKQAVRETARDEARALLHDPFWVAGVVAYWSEGAKRSNRLQFSNSDPDLIVLFLDWAGAYLGLRSDRFRISLHLHSGQDEDERKAYWSRISHLPIGQFRKTYVKPEGTGHRKNRLYNGTATVVVARSSTLLQRVQGWIDAFTADRPSRIH